MDDEPGHATSRTSGERDARRDGNCGNTPRSQPRTAPFNSAIADTLKGLKRG